MTANGGIMFQLFAYETTAAKEYGLKSVPDGEAISLSNRYHLTKPLLIRKPNSFSISVLFETKMKLHSLKKNTKATYLHYAWIGELLLQCVSGQCVVIPS